MTAPGPEPDARDAGASDEPYAVGDHPSLVEQLWIVTRIIFATLLILLGFAIAVGIAFRLT